MNLIGSAITVRYDASTNRFTVDKEAIIKKDETDGYDNHIKHRESVESSEAMDLVKEFFAEIPQLLVNNA
jgi:hypothetical protein